MVEYVDANQPGTRTRAIAVSPETKQVYFLDDKVVGKQTQAWFAAEVLKKVK